MTSLLKTILAIVLFNETSVSLNLKMSNEATYLMTTIELFTKSVLKNITHMDKGYIFVHCVKKMEYVHHENISEYIIRICIPDAQY